MDRCADNHRVGIKFRLALGDAAKLFGILAALRRRIAVPNKLTRHPIATFELDTPDRRSRRRANVIGWNLLQGFFELKENIERVGFNAIGLALLAPQFS